MAGPAKSIDEYKAPWELDSKGDPVADDEQVIDRGKLKKYLFNLLGDKERLQESVTTVTGERDALKTKVDEFVRKDESEADKIKREAAEAVEKAKKDGQTDGDRRALALEVALDVEGITPKQAKTLAKRLSGQTREELEKDAKAIAEDFGFGSKANEGDEEGDEEIVTPAGRPRRLGASGDPAPESSTRKVDLTDPTAIDRLFPR